MRRNFGKTLYKFWESRRSIGMFYLEDPENFFIKLSKFLENLKKNEGNFVSFSKTIKKFLDKLFIIFGLNVKFF